jgi:hypothetical protein
MQVNLKASRNLVSYFRTIFVIMRRGGGRFSVSAAVAASSIGVLGASAGVEGSCSSMVVSLSAMVLVM